MCACHYVGFAILSIGELTGYWVEIMSLSCLLFILHWLYHIPKKWLACRWRSVTIKILDNLDKKSNPLDIGLKESFL